MDNLLKEIGDLVEWYGSLPADFVDFKMIMYKRKQLSTKFFKMTKEQGIARYEWKKAEANLEAQKNIKRSNYSEKNNMQRADWLARANVAKEIKAEAEAGSLYYKMRELNDSIREVLSDMSQTIATLRDEEKENRFFKEN